MSDPSDQTLKPTQNTAAYTFHFFPQHFIVEISKLKLDRS